MKASILFLSLVALACGDEVRWTAVGTVASVSGSGFSATGASPGAAVSVEMSYDSGATLDEQSFLIFPGAGDGGGDAYAGRAHFYGAVGLRIAIRVGELVWEGRLPEVARNQLTPTIETVSWDLGGAPDTMSVDLREAEGASFPEFSFGGAPGERRLEIELTDSVTPCELLYIHVLPPTTTDTSQVTAASGAVRAGGESITFTLDPATVRVSGPPVPASISARKSGVDLSWPSEDGKTYRIEDSGDFRVWRKVGESELGSGEVMVVPLSPFGEHPERRFYRVFEE